MTKSEVVHEKELPLEVGTPSAADVALPLADEIGMAEYYRLTKLIDQLEPEYQYQVILRTEPYIYDEVVRKFHENTCRYFEAILSAIETRNSLAYNFRRVYEKNPMLVLIGCISICMAVFKFGFAFSGTLEYIKMNGFWGDK